MSIKQAIEALEAVVAYDENDAQDGLEVMLLYAKAIEQSRAALAALRSMPQPVSGLFFDAAMPTEVVKWLSEHPPTNVVPATPPTEAVRMSEAEILRDQDIEDWISTIATVNCWGVNMSREQAFRFARAVEQATAARLGVKMGDARHADQA